LLGDTIVGGSAHPITVYRDTSLIIGIQWRNVEFPVDEGFSEVIITDTTGNILKRRLLLSENTIPIGIITTFDNKILITGTYNLFHIYLWKLNSDLEDDTLYTQPFTYDSLCPYPIPSDTVDLNCGVYVSIDEIPLKEDYDKAMKVYPNPVATIINFEFKDLKTDAVLSVYDNYCRLVDDIEIPAYTKKIQTDITAYPAGLYLAVLKSSKNILAKEKFMVGR
ncbi:MAG: T9SS type A sorting domain-containing protein, partial [Bacteroidetes bacterium]|nr:T9SS type A sorting domain-containing protein [Bacteroidota bacterium]